MSIDITIAMVNLISQNSDITDRVGSRIYSDHPPENATEPYIVLWVHRENAIDALDGPLGMDQPSMRIECCDKKRIGASSLRLLVRDHIAGFAGLVDAVHIKGIAQADGQEHITERVKIGTDQYRFVARQDYRISYDSQVQA